MANLEHVAKLKEGKDAWNAWRKRTHKNPDLSGVVLDGDSLDAYDLSNVNFSGADLQRVSFQNAACDDCSFESAFLGEVTFDHAELNRANFKHSMIGVTIFRSCRLAD